jgi:hypothetical protein
MSDIDWYLALYSWNSVMYNWVIVDLRSGRRLEESPLEPEGLLLRIPRPKQPVLSQGHRRVCPSLWWIWWGSQYSAGKTCWRYNSAKYMKQNNVGKEERAKCETNGKHNPEKCDREHRTLVSRLMPSATLLDLKRSERAKSQDARKPARAEHTKDRQRARRDGRPIELDSGSDPTQTAVFTSEKLA